MLKTLGLTNAPLRPYDLTLNSMDGKRLHADNVIDLPIWLGALELEQPLVVVDRLHVDGILGTDALKAFRAVVDLDTYTVTLKGTGDEFPIGSPRVEEMYTTRISSTVRVIPGGKALVVADVNGDAGDVTVIFIAHVPGMDASGLCNPSTDDLLIKKGTLLAAASVVPLSASKFESNDSATKAAERVEATLTTADNLAGILAVLDKP
ncbi:hypothetical protein PInf_018388 [Phytophthora infestans]|nr:hypothetical protein PInf_018388 [Phytophthora infestans]